MFTWSFGWTPSPAIVAMTSFAFMFELVPEPGLEDVDRELVVELAGGDAVAGGGDAVGEVVVEQPEVGVDTRSRAALIRPSQRATGIGMGSPETGKLAIAFSVSGPHRACFSAASATAASVAPGGQTLRMQPLRSTTPRRSGRPQAST